MHRSAMRNERGGAGTDEKVSIGEMVACARCGMYVAEAQALRKEGKVYCGDACMNYT